MVFSKSFFDTKTFHAANGDNECSNTTSQSSCPIQSLSMSFCRCGRLRVGQKIGEEPGFSIVSCCTPILHTNPLKFSLGSHTTSQSLRCSPTAIKHLVPSILSRMQWSTSPSSMTPRRDFNSHSVPTPQAPFITPTTCFQLYSIEPVPAFRSIRSA